MQGNHRWGSLRMDVRSDMAPANYPVFDVSVVSQQTAYIWSTLS